SSPALIEKVRTVTTDSRGEYKIVDLRPGVYTVTFTLSGFSTVKRDGLELTTGFTATANADLKVGGVEETITVSGATPVVDIQNVRTENVLSRDVLDTVPSSKALPAFAALTLGVVLPGTAQDVGGDKGELATTLTIHGGRGDDERQMIDGMKFNTAQLSGGGTIRYYLVNQAAVQEVTLETSGIAAESETGGIQINAVPK